MINIGEVDPPGSSTDKLPKVGALDNELFTNNIILESDLTSVSCPCPPAPQKKGGGDNLQTHTAYLEKQKKRCYLGDHNWENVPWTFTNPPPHQLKNKKRRKRKQEKGKRNKERTLLMQGDFTPLS